MGYIVTSYFGCGNTNAQTCILYIADYIVLIYARVMLTFKKNLASDAMLCFLYTLDIYTCGFEMSTKEIPLLLVIKK